MMRIRQVFEKKNRKSAQLIQSQQVARFSRFLVQKLISCLQKKLETYQQILKSIDTGGPTPPTRRLRHDNVLSSVGQGLKYTTL